MEFPDLPALVRICRAKGVTCALDNTWGAGLAFQAFDLVPGEQLAVDVSVLRDQYQKTLAESAVKRLRGVFGVTNNITVKPQVTPTELRSKIAWLDPSRPGSSSRWTWIISLVQGEDWLKDLFEKQDVTFSRDIRQITDWLVTCTV